jgi:hypothetical protein
MLKGGVPAASVYASWSRLLKDLTNFEWIAFFHCPNIKTPTWPHHIVRLWKRYIKMDRGEAPNKDWGYFISNGGTPSGRASQTTLGNCLNCYWQIMFYLHLSLKIWDPYDRQKWGHRF